MITVAHVNAEAGYSGGEVQMFLLMERLRERGYRNIVVCPPRSSSETEAARRSFRSIGVPMRNDLDLPGVLGLARAFRSDGVDLVHMHTGRATWLGGLASYLAHLPSLSTRRMDRNVKRGLRTRLIYHKLVDHTVAISPAVAECLSRGGVPRARVSVIWDAVDPGEFEAGRDAEHLRTELGLAPGDSLVLAMAALVRRKGIDVLIEALEILAARKRRVFAWIAGTGPERESLEASVRASGLEERVRFLGWRSDKVDLLAAADVLALPSRREGVGVAALEAMAAGVPVVASRVGGLSEAVVDSRTGLLVEPEDPRGLADAIERILADPELASRFASEGAQRVRELFSADNMAERYVEAYERVLETRSPDER